MRWMDTFANRPYSLTWSTHNRQPYCCTCIVNKYTEKWASNMVLCAIVSCGTWSGRDKGVYMAKIPSIITNQGEEGKKLSKQCRNSWILAISREDLTDAILESGRVCANHFVSGRPALVMKRNDPDWIPLLNLGHNKLLSSLERNNEQA